MMDRFRFNEPLNQVLLKYQKFILSSFINTDGLYELCRVGEGSITVYYSSIYSLFYSSIHIQQQVTAM